MRRLVLLAGMLACGGPDAGEPAVLELAPPEAGEVVIVDGVEYIAMPPTEWAAEDVAPPDVIEKRSYVIPSGYGQGGGSKRCNNFRFPGGRCQIPKYKNACLRNYYYGKTSPQYMADARQEARETWAWKMGTLGWNTAIQDIQCAFTLGQVIIGFAELPSGVAGVTTPLVNSNDVFTVSAGTVYPWTHVQIRIDPDEIEDNDGFGSRSDAEQYWFTYNIIMHELIHASGMAHNTDEGTLMFERADDDFYAGPFGALQEEYDLIEGYSSR